VCDVSAWHSRAWKGRHVSSWWRTRHGGSTSRAVGQNVQATLMFTGLPEKNYS
jgi:hypothetical protein